MIDESRFTQDWLQNWQAKIAVRITSIIIWSLSFVSMLIAGLLISQVKNDLEESQNIIIDHLTFQIYQNIQQNNSISYDDLRYTLQYTLHHNYINAITISHKNQVKTFGKIDKNNAVISRVLMTPGKFTISIYTPPFIDVVRREQIKIFMIFSLGIIVLGGFIGFVIDKSVKKPFQHLESTARKYTSGQRDSRANINTLDEFGELALFLNKMLDRINENEDSLQREVEERKIAHGKIKQQRDALQNLANDLTLARDLAYDANKAKSSFLANMSHELRTPLNAIIGYSELIKEEPSNKGNTTLTDDVDKILKSGKHLLQLINQILDISKIESGKMELIVEAISISSLADEVSNVITPMIEQNNNTLCIEINKQAETIHTDAIRIKQVLFNLLDNANKFTHNGKIDFIIEQKKHITSFTIKDTGIGIESEKIIHIFDEFIQADISTTRRYGGTGLGLSICRHLIHLMGGEIIVSSTPGEGSCFVIKLPTNIKSNKEIS